MSRRSSTTMKEPADVWEHIRWLDLRRKREKRKRVVKSPTYACDHIHCPATKCEKP